MGDKCKVITNVFAGYWAIVYIYIHILILDIMDSHNQIAGLNHGYVLKKCILVYVCLLTVFGRSCCFFFLPSTAFNN